MTFDGWATEGGGLWRKVVRGGTVFADLDGLVAADQHERVRRRPISAKVASAVVLAFVVLLIGGNETTNFALSNGLYILFNNPEIFPQLQADKSKIKTAKKDKKVVDT